jgi:uncharacterized membrane protein/protein-disulfide isomerase
VAKKRTREEPSRDEGREDPRLLVFRLFAAFALGASLLLLYEYLQPAATFCSEAGGCDLVRQSRWARLAGIPTPVFGVVAFGVLLVLSFLRRARLLAVSALVIAAGGIGFLVLMVSVIKAWCVYCAFSDLSAIVMGAIGVLLLRSPPDEARRPAAVPSALAVLLGIAAPFVFGLAVRPGAQSVEPQNTIVEPEELPEPVAREQAPGVAIIVEWLDFECPACRAQNEVFERLLPQYGDRVRLIRKMLPLPMHEHAADAAAAYCCAEEARHGEEMAHLLMASEDVSKEACEAMAEKLGMSLDEFRECVGSERIAKRLAQEKQEAISVGVKALPTYYIGRERFEGGRDDDTIRASIERAIKEAQGS